MEDLAFKDVPEGKSAMAIMGLKGDIKTVWDPRNADEVAAAKAQFDRLKAQRFRAYRVTGKDGARGEPMDTFDPEAARMIMVPPMQGG